ncbi:MAG TPA: transaldolase family protein, partial [Anaerolineae bacterium]|nr:transaldolase family protein [Anaerolineae bacterium]
MEIYLDTANIEEIREAVKMGVVSGVTTNPSLMMREGRGDYRQVTQEICYLVQGPISAEVVGTDTEQMVKEAREIAQWSPYVVIKIPLTPNGLEAISILAGADSDEENICQGCTWVKDCPLDRETASDLALAFGIRTNATLVFSTNQALLAALAGASYASVFVGRLDDAGHEGMTVVAEAAEILATYGLDTEIIAASIRHPLHVTEAALAGADVATVPYAVLQKMVRHPLTDVGIDRFL